MKTQSCIPALLVWSLSASAATIRIDPSTTSTSIGSTIDVNVQIADGADLYAYQFDLTFNPAILSASTMSEASFLAGGGSTFFIPGAIDNVLGSITLTANTLQGPVPGVSGSGRVAIIQFTALTAGTSTITLSNVVLVNSTAADIPANVENGTVSVSATVAPEPASGRLVASIIAFVIARNRERCLRSWLQ